MIEMLPRIVSAASLFSLLICASGNAKPAPQAVVYSAESDGVVMAKCEKGEASACYYLARRVVQRKGSAGLTSAEYWLVKEAYEKGCNLGYKNACHNLAVAYEDDAVLGNDTDQQIKWFGKGCALGDREDCKLAKLVKDYDNQQGSTSPTPKVNSPSSRRGGGNPRSCTAFDYSTRQVRSGGLMGDGPSYRTIYDTEITNNCSYTITVKVMPLGDMDIDPGATYSASNVSIGEIRRTPK